MNKERERTIKILRKELMPVWLSGTNEQNEINKGFNKGINKAIEILEKEIDELAGSALT